MVSWGVRVREAQENGELGSDVRGGESECRES